MTPYERVVAERLQAEAAAILLPSKDRWAPAAKRRTVPWPLIAAAMVVFVLISSVLVLGESAQAPVARQALSALRSLVRPQAQSVPATWNVFVSEGLVLAVPPEFGAPRSAPVPIMLGPNAPTLLRSLDFDRGLSVLVWKGTVRRLLDESWLRGQTLPYTRRPLSAPLSGEEVLTRAEGQRDPAGGPSGTDEARSLFIQIAPDEVAHIFLGSTSATAPGTATTISASDRATQDQMAILLRRAPDADKHIDRGQVETVLRRVVGQLHNADVPPGDSMLARIFSGEQWIYNWPNSSHSFAYIVLYPDRAARERDSVEIAVSWGSPVAQRGVGNLLVLVGSDDPNVRYRMLAALDELAR